MNLQCRPSWEGNPEGRVGRKAKCVEDWGEGRLRGLGDRMQRRARCPSEFMMGKGGGEREIIGPEDLSTSSGRVEKKDS